MPNNMELRNADFIAWLEAHPMREKYDYASNTGCPIAQFLTSLGYRNVAVGSEDFWHVYYLGDGVHDLPLGWNRVVNGDGPDTYGAAAKRARASLPFDGVTTCS